MRDPQISLWGEPAQRQPAPEPRTPLALAYKLIELERLISLVTELHPDHWPPGVIFLAERIAHGHPWAWVEGAPGSETSTTLAFALVGRDPDERRRGLAESPMKPRARELVEANVKLYAPLRAAVIESVLEAMEFYW
jgi:hypothetical protein